MSDLDEATDEDVEAAIEAEADAGPTTIVEIIGEAIERRFA